MWAEANGGSMAPLVRAGDALWVEPLAGPPRVGDILAIPTKQGLCGHRVVHVRHEQGAWRALLRGDARDSCDGEVGPREVVGRITLQRRGGHVLDHRRPSVRALDLAAARLGGSALLARAARRFLAFVADRRRSRVLSSAA